MEIRYSHPDEGLLKTLTALADHGIEEQSRNGPVRRFAEPVMLINENPLNRVSVAPVRDANTFFHFMESLWMLAGMNEIKPLLKYNGGMAQYSDDGDTLRGTAYGFKWRSHFGYDQLELAVKRLRENPTDRRVVMTMWDPRGEWQNSTSKDLSCNLQIILGTREVKGLRYLDMEVTNRSNDIVYGCLGSNVFHFSYLLEYLCWRTNLRPGKYYQVAFNLHGYLENPTFAACYEAAKRDSPEFSAHEALPDVPGLLLEMGMDPDTPEKLAEFVRTGETTDDYLKAVGVPLYEAYRIFKLGSAGIKVDPRRRLELAMEVADQCVDPHLAVASTRWLRRRLDNVVKKESDPFS